MNIGLFSMSRHFFHSFEDGRLPVQAGFESGH
jgi:hypothetical protein